MSTSVLDEYRAAVVDLLGYLLEHRYASASDVQVLTRIDAVNKLHPRLAEHAEKSRDESPTQLPTTARQPLTLIDRLPVALCGYRTGPDGYTVDLSWFAGDTLAIPLDLPQQNAVLKVITDAWNERRRLTATVTITITEDAP